MSHAGAWKPRSLLLWPIILLWKLVSFVVTLTGILLGLGLGVLFMILGLALTATFVGAIVGIPLFILGFMLLLRALY
jgi:hypothetical protein